MSLRKIAGLAGAFALAAGMIGTGVSAAFTDQVSAVENIHVGTFSCAISSATGNVSGKTLTYNAPDITSSVASSAPFAFTVTNTGTIPAVLQLSATALAAPFSDILVTPVANVTLAGGVSTTYNAGIQWSELVKTDLGKSVSITYTVNCGEVGTPTVSFYSTNRGIYGGQDSIRFAGSGSGFTPGDTVGIVYSAPFEGPQDLASYWGLIGLSAPVVDASGSFTYWFADNCNPGGVGTNQPVTVTATDLGHPATIATGTGTLACGLMP
jgi:predicted ribosomally synthesized peptide with SipW-like signal peptide